MKENRASLRTGGFLRAEGTAKTGTRGFAMTHRANEKVRHYETWIHV